MLRREFPSGTNGSIGHLFRGIVVLVFLISIPALAIFWERMPAGVQNTLTAVRARVQGDQPRTEPVLPEPRFEQQIPVTLPPTVQDSSYSMPKPLEKSKPSSIRLISGNRSDVAPVVSAPELSAEQTAISQMETELKNLGATYYRLESWGNGGSLYRFSCFVSPQPGDQRFRQHFQSIESSPVTAMQNVRDAVVSWQNQP